MRKCIFPLTVIFLFLLIISPFAADKYLKPLDGWRIIIDPGTGREFEQTPFIEKDEDPLVDLETTANDNIAQFLSDFLTRAGAEIKISRDRNEQAKSIEDRIKTAKEFNSNLILSIHHDYRKSEDDNFVKCYYYPDGEEPGASIARAVAETLSSEIDIQNQGAGTFPYPILTRTEIPGVMISCGNITNSKFRKKIDDLEFNRKQALGIMKGMIQFQKDLTGARITKPPMNTTAPMSSPPPPTAPSRLPVVTEVTPIPPPPSVPVSQPPMPAPQPISEQKKELPPPQPGKEFNPPLMNPANAPFDQSWLYGEAWGTLQARKGVSFDIPAGTKIKAAADGKVIVVSDSPPPSAPGYPNTVIIEHAGLVPKEKKMYTVYGKLADIEVKEGQNVKKGDIVGTAGEPSTEDAPTRRDTEFEFQVRIGENREAARVNPELYVGHATEDTGIIVGRLANSKGEPVLSTNITGVRKPPYFRRYNYSMTYADEVPSSPEYQENFVIGDVQPGSYFLQSDRGIKRIYVEANKVTVVEWTVP